MKIKINSTKKSQATVQAGIRANDLLKKAIPLYVMWGTVLLANSEHNTVDVELMNGVELRNIEVRSLEWAGVNSVGYGERDLPPKDCPVLIIFPNGSVESGFVLCSALNRFESKHKTELLVSGKEEEYLRIREGGLKETYDKSTGAWKIEVNDAIINIDANGKVIITPASGQNIELAGNTKNLVTHAELDTALQTFITVLNAHVHAGVTSGGASTAIPTPMSLNISGAEATRLETS